MSYDWERWARQNAVGTPSDRHVLLVLAGYADDAGKAWPGITTLAAVTGLHRSTVVEAIRRLEAAELIVADRGVGRGHHSTYHLDPKRSADTTFSSALKGRLSRDKRSPQPRKGRLSRDKRSPQPTRTVSELSVELSEELSAEISRRAPRELIEPALLPVPSPNGDGGALAKGRKLDALIAEARARRPVPITRRQAVEARNLARDALEAGWDPAAIVDGLVECSTFSRGAFDYAVDQLRRRGAGEKAPAHRMTAAERADAAVLRAIREDPGR